MVSNQSMSSPPPEAAALSPGQREAPLREIVVFIDGHTKAGGILEFAGELAEEHGARLIGVFLQPEPTITPAETFARGTGMQRVSESHRSQLERIDARLPRSVLGHRPSSRTPARLGVEVSALLQRRGGRACVLRGRGGGSLNRGLMAGRIALLASRSPLS